MLAAAAAVCLGLGLGHANAQPAGSDRPAVSSHSGQFTVYGGRSFPLPRALSEVATNQTYVQLEPTLAAVSCERIKDLLLRELGATAPWRWHIYVVLFPAQSFADPVTIISERFKDGWRYRVDLPDVLERPRYVRAVVQVLLLEMANRTPGVHAADIPLWLTEGFTQMLLASSEVEIILPPPRGKENGLNVNTMMVNTWKGSLRDEVQKKLHGRPPLTFEDLSWPDDDELTGPRADPYSGSAQLFVGELLRLPDGRACLQNMVAQLPQHYNWQFAFLGGFHAYFQRPLDVEKWWALSVAETTGRDLAPTWTLQESWQKLDQAIHASVQVRADTNALPLHAEADLQTIIREWDTVRQTEALTTVLRQLAFLRLRIAQEFGSLVQDYWKTLDTYLQQRDRSGSVIPFVRNANRRRAVAAAVHQLDTLDARLQALRPKSKSPNPAQPSVTAAAPPQYQSAQQVAPSKP